MLKVIKAVGRAEENIIKAIFLCWKKANVKI